MATWIKGDTTDQFNGEGEAIPGPRSFYHALKTRTSKTTLCGVELGGEIDKLSESKEKKTETKQFCHACRVILGETEEFGSDGDTTHHPGTRAFQPRAGKQVA